MPHCELSNPAQKRYAELCKSIPELGKKCTRHANALWDEMWEMAEQVHELKAVCHSLGKPYERDAIRLCKGETAFHYLRDLYTACDGSKKKALECGKAPYTLLRDFRKERAEKNKEKKGKTRTKAKGKAAAITEPVATKPIMGKLYLQRATGDIVRADEYDGNVVQVQPLDIDNIPQGDPITVQFEELEGPVTVEKYRSEDEETDHDADEADHGLKATLATIKELAANGPWEILTAIIGVLGLKWADVIAWAQQQAKLGGDGDESIEATPSAAVGTADMPPVVPLTHENRPWNMGSHKRQLIELCGGVGQAAGYLIQDWPEAREWLEKALQTEIAADYRISGVAVDKDNNLIDAREAALKSLVFHCGGIEPAAGFVFDHLGEKKNINPAKAKKKPAKPRPVAKKEKQEKPLPPGQAKADRAKVGGYFRMRETGEDWRIVHVKAIWRSTQRGVLPRGRCQRRILVNQRGRGGMGQIQPCGLGDEQEATEKGQGR